MDIPHYLQVSDKEKKIPGTLIEKQRNIMTDHIIRKCHQMDKRTKEITKEKKIKS
jgi:hypothetical protein